jgi:tRNA(Phe) wybutosine-synthesizing methylase Tyw3
LRRPKEDNSCVGRIYVATNAESSLRIVSKWMGAVR